MGLPKIVKSINQLYKSTSAWGKVLFLIVLVLFVAMIWKPLKEGFEDNREFTFKKGGEVYDSFYSEIYDHLVFNGVKDEFEIGQIIEKTKPTQESRILDIGSGTGHHVAILNKKGFDATGIDNSTSMVEQAKKNYPEYDFQQSDCLKATQFHPESFTHILCFYFTLYYIKDKSTFFSNCYNWLMPGGYLVVHIVNREHFDPIVPPANPLLMLTPQRYAKERITKSRVTFDDFKYDANFVLENDTNNAKFVETFKNKKSGKIFRKQEHQMYMEGETEIVEVAKQQGFIVKDKIDLIKAGYEYNYLYVFVRSS
jgi:SAM-dependent methyltransferase